MGLAIAPRIPLYDIGTRSYRGTNYRLPASFILDVLGMFGDLLCIRTCGPAIIIIVETYKSAELVRRSIDLYCYGLFIPTCPTA